MERIQSAIFPGIIIGSLFVFVVSFWIATPQMAEASASLQESSGKSASETTSCSLAASYPESVRKWCGLIESYSSKSSLDANLVAAVILQESGGNPDAYSHSGAVGLMQVMPRDGLAGNFMCVNGPCFASRPSMNELYDPEFNIAYGSRFLAGLNQKYGDIREALIAYGPKDVGSSYADAVLAVYNRSQ
jgi:soluble lytic murein transglycosylase-like protein